MMPKKLMTEEDIKLQYITPALTKKWNVRKISMEAKVTDGKVNLKGNMISRGAPKRADYLLHISDNNPIAVVEAKDNKHSISHGLQQAMAYAQMLDLPFAYSSNGDGFAEHDFLTGKEREFVWTSFQQKQSFWHDSRRNLRSLLHRKQSPPSPITVARIPILPDTISVSPSTVRWMPSQEGRIDSFWSWPLALARPTLRSKSSTDSSRAV